MQSRDTGLFALLTLIWVPKDYPSWVIDYSQERKTHNGLVWVRVLMGPAEVYSISSSSLSSSSCSKLLRPCAAIRLFENPPIARERLLDSATRRVFSAMLIQRSVGGLRGRKWSVKLDRRVSSARLVYNQAHNLLR